MPDRPAAAASRTWGRSPSGVVGALRFRIGENLETQPTGHIDYYLAGVREMLFGRKGDDVTRRYPEIAQ